MGDASPIRSDYRTLEPPAGKAPCRPWNKWDLG